jgi:uncharacterized protein (TIGR00369 family)
MRTADTNPRDPDWERRVRDVFARQSFMATIGARIAALSLGACELELPFRPDLCQQHAYLHGGVVAAIADTSGGIAAASLMPAGAGVLTVEFKINLMAPAAGTRFRARGRTVRAGRTLCTVESEVAAETGGEWRPVARMLATIMCLEGKGAIVGSGGAS